jgi:hypothetical protein
MHWNTTPLRDRQLGPSLRFTVPAHLACQARRRYRDLRRFGLSEQQARHSTAMLLSYLEPVSISVTRKPLEPSSALAVPEGP